MQKMLILRPDGRCEEHELPEDESRRLEVLQAAVGGSIEYLSPSFHGLQNHDVVINEDGYERLPRNAYGCRAIGYDLSRYAPLYGPIVLVPRMEGASAARERAEQDAFFETLERVVNGELDPAVLGYDFVIDAREEAP